MKNLTHSSAVNRELSAIQTRNTVKKSISTENKVFIILGVLVTVAIIMNILVYGVPSI